MTTQTQEVRAFTPVELAALIRVLREARQWSQETLATLAGLTPRTIQRVEAGEMSSTDTRRALARALEFEDIDVFNKSHEIPDAEAIKTAHDEFEKNHLTLVATTLDTGKALTTLIETCEADICSDVADLAGDAAEAFATLVDYVHDYRDCAELYSAVQKLEVYRDLQDLIDALSASGVNLCYATRQVRLGVKSGDAGVPMTLLYLAAFPKDRVPKQLVVPKAIHW